MTFSLTWLADVLRDVGLPVAEQHGWENRGRRDMTSPAGVICHHTAGPKTGNAPSLNTVIHGRPDLNGPLAQLVLGRDGTYYVVAAGTANHAGAGKWQGITQGNGRFIGIEAENTGHTRGRLADPWPLVQMNAYRWGVAAILRHIGAGASMCCGHFEYALPKGRKTDPTFDMDQFRLDVDACMTILGVGGVGDPLHTQPVTQPPLQYTYGRYI
jgi:hypothetical protein